MYMVKVTQVPVIFMATKIKREPMVVNFFTEDWEPIAEEFVKKKRTKHGVRLYTLVKK